MVAEILFAGADSASRRVRREFEAGRLRKLYSGIYTSDLHSLPEDIVARNWLSIIGHLLPGGVISFRSAFDGSPVGGALYLTRGKTRRRLELPGLTVNVIPGPGPVADVQGANDMKMGELFLSSDPRRYLENLSGGRGASNRELSKEEIEAKLELLASIKGDDYLKKMREQAKTLAEPLDLGPSFVRLDKFVGALLGSRPDQRLATKAGRARAPGVPFDSARAQIFDTLFGALNRSIFKDYPDAYRTVPARTHFAFLESYFSNFIEGTEFEIEEAEGIVLKGEIVQSRPEDSHDIQATFQCADGALREAFPSDANGFLDSLKHIHRIVLSGRGSLKPGEWKEHRNRAGNTSFVEPALVQGTLREGFERIAALADPFAKALMTSFVISEVHPFADGNGRTARLLMNASLSSAQKGRVIVPSLYREDYILSLTALSHNSEPGPFIETMSKLANWTASFEYRDLHAVVAAMKQSNAFSKDRDNYKLLIAV